MDVAALIDHLASDGPLLIGAAQRAGWDAPVPATEWTVRELVTHVGGVHRWAADIVRTGATTTETPAGDAVGTGPGDDVLAAWFTDGHAALVETLRAAPAELQCAAFLPADSPRHFWARRQAHETAIHRADAEAAAGETTPFDRDFAQDGIAEMLNGFARRKRKLPEGDATIALAASDGPSWLITIAGERIESMVSDAQGDVTVRGRSQDLYRWLWNRPAEVVVEGDDAIAARWPATVRVRWS